MDLLNTIDRIFKPILAGFGVKDELLAPTVQTIGVKKSP
jgi:hypothetical protein